MSHRIEERDGIQIIHVSGEVTAVESLIHFRTIAEFLQHGPAFIRPSSSPRIIRLFELSIGDLP